MVQQKWKSLALLGAAKGKGDLASAARSQFTARSSAQMPNTSLKAQPFYTANTENIFRLELFFCIDACGASKEKHCEDIYKKTKTSWHTGALF